MSLSAIVRHLRLDTGWEMLAVILDILPRGEPVKDGFLDRVDQTNSDVIRFIRGKGQGDTGALNETSRRYEAVVGMPLMRFAERPMNGAYRRDAEIALQWRMIGTVPKCDKGSIGNALCIVGEEFFDLRQYALNYSR
jgi:hypothetical protein